MDKNESQENSKTRNTVYALTCIRHSSPRLKFYSTKASTY